MSDVRSARTTVQVREKSEDEKEAAAELATLNSEIKDSNIELQRLEGLKVDLADTIQKLEADTNAKEIERDSIFAQIENLSDDLAAINTSVNSLTAEESALKEKISTLELDHQNKTRSLNTEHQQHVSENNIELEKVTKELLDARQALIVLQNDITNVTSKRESLEKSFDARIIELTDLTESIVISTQKKESLESEVKTLEAQKVVLESKNADLDAKIDEGNRVLFDLTAENSLLKIENANLIESNKAEMYKIDQEKFALSNREKVLEIQTAFIKSKYDKAGVQFNP